jgi:hypothetical protein
LQIDLVGVHRAISVEGSPCGGELGATQQINVLPRTAPNRPRFGSILRGLLPLTGQGQRPSDKKAKRVLALHKEGLSYRLIGRNVGLSKNTVMDIVRRAGSFA